MKWFVLESTFRRWCIGVCFAAVCSLIVMGKPAIADIPLDAQVQSLINLSTLEGRHITDASARKILGTKSRGQFSFSQFQKAAESSGMKLVTQKITLSNLRKMDAPAIVRLNKTDEIVTIAAIGQRFVLVYEGANLNVWLLKVLSQRYDGEAMFFKRHLNHKPTLVVDEPIREVNVNGKGDTSSFSVPVHNSGTHSVTLRVQSTSCGCTSDDHSIKVLKPGQSGELHFKTTARSDRMISAVIATNDSIKPVFVVGFLIQTPDFCKTCGF